MRRLVVALVLGVVIGVHLERDAQVRRARDEMRRRCLALGGSVVTTHHDGGAW
jgi:hypothetical protein